MFRRNFPLFEEATGDPEGGGTAVAAPPVDPQPPAQSGPNLEEQLAQLRQRLDAQDRELRSRTAPPPAPPPAAPPQPQFDKKAFEQQFYSDPAQVFQQFGHAIKETTRREVLNEVLALQGTTLEEAARQTARSQDPELWDALQVEIAAAMQDVPAPYRNNATVWVNAFNNVKGANIQKVMEIKGRSQQQQTQNRGVPDGPVPPSHRQVQPPKKAELTPEEREIIRKMNTTEDVYRMGKEAVENPNVFWSKFITFDSRNSRRTEMPAKKGGK